MATVSYSDPSTPYPAARAGARAPRDLGATIFIWVAWAAAAFFQGLVLTTALRIVESPAPAAGPAGTGAADVGGVGWALMEIVGVFILGVALAWGLARYATRDKRKDPMTEASTHALYDIVEARGGEDDVGRSPEAHEPRDRDALPGGTPIRP